MELFLLVSMVFTFLTFSLIVLSDPPKPVIVENQDSVSDSFASERISEASETMITSQSAMAI